MGKTIHAINTASMACLSNGNPEPHVVIYSPRGKWFKGISPAKIPYIKGQCAEAEHPKKAQQNQTMQEMFESFPDGPADLHDTLQIKTFTCKKLDTVKKDIMEQAAQFLFRIYKDECEEEASEKEAREEEQNHRFSKIEFVQEAFCILYKALASEKSFGNNPNPQILAAASFGLGLKYGSAYDHWEIPKRFFKLMSIQGIGTYEQFKELYRAAECLVWEAVDFSFSSPTTTMECIFCMNLLTEAKEVPVKMEIESMCKKACTNTDMILEWMQRPVSCAWEVLESVDKRLLMLA